MFKGESATYLIGFGVGILIVAFAFLIIKLITKKGSKRSLHGCQFDERQLLARAKAAKVGFITLCSWQVFSLVINWFVEITFISHSILSFVGLIIGLTAFVISCIWNDAYFSFSQAGAYQKTRFYVFMPIMALINALIFFAQGGLKNFFATGKITETKYCNLIVAIFLVVILINTFIKDKVDKLKQQNGEE